MVFNSITQCYQKIAALCLRWPLFCNSFIFDSKLTTFLLSFTYYKQNRVNSKIFKLYFGSFGIYFCLEVNNTRHKWFYKVAMLATQFIFQFLLSCRYLQGACTQWRAMKKYKCRKIDIYDSYRVRLRYFARILADTRKLSVGEHILSHTSTSSALFKQPKRKRRKLSCIRGISTEYAIGRKSASVPKCMIQMKVNWSSNERSDAIYRMCIIYLSYIFYALTLQFAERTL